MNKNSVSLARSVRGFTLLEIMLVMMLLGGLATLIMTTRPAKNTKWAGEKLALELRTIAHRAILEQRLYGAVVYRDGIRLLVLTRTEQDGVQSQHWPEYYWHSVSNMKKKLTYSLPTEITLTLSVESNVLITYPMNDNFADEPQLIFQPDGENSDFIVGLFQREERVGQIINQRGNLAFFAFDGKGQSR